VESSADIIEFACESVLVARVSDCFESCLKHFIVVCFTESIVLSFLHTEEPFLRPLEQEPILLNAVFFESVCDGAPSLTLSLSDAMGNISIKHCVHISRVRLYMSFFLLKQKHSGSIHNS
jgi:hypothetical protein